MYIKVEDTNVGLRRISIRIHWNYVWLWSFYM